MGFRAASRLLISLSVFHVCVCHVVWEHPTPRYDQDNQLKAHPCGTGGQLNDWTATTTTLQPGKQLLKFRETITHSGAPCRIGLTVGTDDHYSEYVLLDHIPHNDGAEMVDGSVMHAVEVEIPPVDCSAQNCGLQLIQVMTDKFAQGETCANPTGLVTSCGNPAFAYFSCANIKIEGGTVAQPEPFYHSWIGGAADSREPYRPGETGTWCYDAENEHWRLHGNGFECPGMDPPGGAQDVVQVRFDLDKLDGTDGETGCFVMEIHPEWAPKGAARMQELLDASFYQGVRFFRVIPDFMAQFGISGDPAVSAVWREATIEDDAVLQSNTRSHVSFATAGPDTRTTQLFINFKDNSFLDSQGFSPFARISHGMEAVDRIYAVGEQPQQGLIQSQGNEYLNAIFPQLTYIRSTEVIDWDGTGDPCPAAAAGPAAPSPSLFEGVFYLSAALGPYPDSDAKGAATLGEDSRVWVVAEGDGGLRVHYFLTGLPAEETSGGAHVHAGTSCDAHELVMAHFYTTAEDPWVSGWTKAAGSTVASGSVVVAPPGPELGDNEGHAFVVHEHSGKRIACGILRATLPDSPLASPAPVPAGLTGPETFLVVVAVLVFLGAAGVLWMRWRRSQRGGGGAAAFELRDRKGEDLDGP